MAARAEQVRVDVSGLVLDGPEGSLRLGELAGTRLVVLMRHRH